MRSILRIIVLAPSLCTIASFAVDGASSNVPFSFESQGQLFPASQYDVKLNRSRTLLTMSSRNRPRQSLSWAVDPVEVNPDAPTMTIQFDELGKIHTLRIIRLGSYETPILDPDSIRSIKNLATPAAGR
jgi:hypothetical protein